MGTTSCPQQRYDHRLRDLVRRTGDVTLATDLGVPRSTARGWVRAAPTVIVSLDVADLTEPELRQEILKLRRRVEKLAALLRFSSDYLHRWWSYRLKHEATVRPLADIVADAQTLALTPRRSFETIVPLTSAIRIPAGVAVPEWRAAADVSEWLRRNNCDVSGVRQDGGFLFEINALDPEAAVAQCAEMIDQLVARMAVGTRRNLALVGHVWVGGERTSYAMDRKRRGVWVEALEREHPL